MQELFCATRRGEDEPSSGARTRNPAIAECAFPDIATSPRPEDTEPKSISERTSRNRRAASYLCADAVPASPEGAMIYIVAFLLPPLGLLLNGQPFSAIFNLVLLVPCLLLGFIFPPLWLVPSLHAVIAVHMRREDRKHRQIVEAIEKHGPPPWWLR
jgi:hypothetical protein